MYVTKDLPVYSPFSLKYQYQRSAWSLFSSFTNDAAVLVQTRWCFIFYETQVCFHHWGGLIPSTKYRHFNASLLVRKRFRAFPVHLILPSPSFSSPCLFFFFSTLKDEIVSQTGSLNIFNMTMPSSHLSLSHTHFLLSIL